MASPDLSEVADDSEMAESWSIIRSAGAFGAGGWIQQSTTIPAYGVVTVAEAKDLEMVPEGDRVTEIRAFYTTQQLFVTNAQNNQTSDVLVWQGTKYRIIKEPDYNNRGYWKALATRMLGD